MNSPGLLRLMQQNDKKVSDIFKKKQTKNSLKKLKKEENEAKSAMANRDRLKVRAIQEMFDEMAKKNALENSRITGGVRRLKWVSGAQI